MSNSRTLKVAIALAALVAGAYSLRSGPAEKKESAHSVAQETSHGEARADSSPDLSPNSGAARPVTSHQTPKETREESARAPETVETGGDASSAANKKRNFRFERELAGYSGLKKKVFATNDVQEEKARLFENTELIRGLESLLKTPAFSDPELQELQNDAIDLLLEARAATKSDVPAEVLRSLIEDPQIENEKLDLKSREALAGVKAEVMYQWTSQEPEASRSVASWLPGPVSAKIWQNVRAAQEQNRLESLQEVKQ